MTYQARGSQAMQLTRLIYASKHDGVCDKTIDCILQTSRANNVRWGLTGALVVSDKLQNLAAAPD